MVLKSIIDINTKKILYLFLIILAGLNFMQKQKEYWKQSSEITKNTLKHIKNNYSPNKEIFFINLPDSVNGPPWNAYVFRRGLDNALENIYGYTPIISFYRTIPLDEKVREDEYIEPENLYNLSLEDEVFMYNPQTSKVEKL